MVDMLARNWWVFAVRGVAAIIFGILAFAWPGITLVVLVALFAAYAIVDGVMALVALVRGDPEARRHGWAVGIMGVLGIVAGIAAFAVPGVTALALLYIVAIWAIAIGILQIITAIRLRREIQGELWMAIGGAILIVYGVFLIVFPGTGLLSLVWLVAAMSIAFGVASLVLAWQLRKRAQGMPAATAPTGTAAA
jgi:uncharacterized membrane protein HdeD (DUF308 family)